MVKSRPRFAQYVVDGFSCAFISKQLMEPDLTIEIIWMSNRYHELLVLLMKWKLRKAHMSTRFTVLQCAD